MRISGGVGVGSLPDKLSHNRDLWSAARLMVSQASDQPLLPRARRYHSGVPGTHIPVTDAQPNALVTIDRMTNLTGHQLPNVV